MKWITPASFAPGVSVVGMIRSAIAPSSVASAGGERGEGGGGLCCAASAACASASRTFDQSLMTHAAPTPAAVAIQDLREVLIRERGGGR